MIAMSQPEEGTSNTQEDKSIPRSPGEASVHVEAYGGGGEGVANDLSIEVPSTLDCRQHHQEASLDSRDHGLRDVLCQVSRCRVLEADEELSDCCQTREAAQRETRENGAILQDSWNPADVTIKQEVEEENGTPRAKGSEDGTEGPQDQVQWSYLCEVVLPMRTPDVSADVCSSTDDGEDKKDVLIDNARTVSIENSSPKTLDSPPGKTNKIDSNDDVTAFPALQKPDDVTDRSRKSSESVNESDKSDRSTDVDGENRTRMKSSNPQEEGHKSSNVSEIRQEANLRSSEKPSSKSVSFLKYIFGKNVSDRSLHNRMNLLHLREKSTTKHVEDSVQSVQFSLPWKRPPEKRSQVDKRVSLGSEVDPPPESLKGSLQESVEANIQEEKPDNAGLLTEGFQNTASGEVAAEQPLAGSENTFQGRRTECEGSALIPAAVQRSLGRRKQTNPRQRPAKCQGRVDDPQWDAEESRIAQSEETLKHVRDADRQANEKHKDNSSGKSQTLGQGTASVPKEVKSVNPNTLAGKQPDGKDLSLFQTKFDTVNKTTPGFIVPVLKNSSLPPKHPYHSSSPAPTLVQRLKSGKLDLTQLTFCLQSFAGTNFEVEQSKEDSALLAKKNANTSDSFTVPSIPFINTQASSAVSHSTTELGDIMNFSHQKTAVIKTPQTEQGKSSPSGQDGASSRDTTMASSSAVLSLADMSGTCSSNSSLYSQPLSGSGDKDSVYHVFGIRRGYEKVQVAPAPATARDSSQTDASGNNSQYLQEDKNLSAEAKLAGTESINNSQSHKTASISAQTSTRKSSSKRKSQTKTRLTSHQALIKKDAQRQAVFASSALPDGVSQEVINKHPLLQPIFCTGIATERHAKSKARKKSFTDESKRQLSIRSEGDPTLFHDALTATSPGTLETSRNNIQNKQHENVQEEGTNKRTEPLFQVSPPSEQSEQFAKSVLTPEQRDKETDSVHPVQQGEEKAGGTKPFSIVSAVSNLLHSLTAKTKDTTKNTPQGAQSFPAVATLTHIVSEIKRKDTAAKKNTATEEKSRSSKSQGKKKVLQGGTAQHSAQGPQPASTITDKQTGAGQEGYEVTKSQTNRLNVSIEKGVKAKRSKKTTPKTGRGGVMVSPLEKQGTKNPVPLKSASPGFPTNTALSVPSIPIPFGNFSFLPLQLLAPNIHMLTSHLPNSSTGNAEQALTSAASSGDKTDDSSLSTMKEQNTHCTSHVGRVGSQSAPCRNGKDDLEGSSMEGNPVTGNVSYSQAPLLGLPPAGSGIPVFFLLPHSQLLALGPAASGGSVSNLRCRQDAFPLDTCSVTPSPARRQTQRAQKPKLQPKKKCRVNSESPSQTNQISIQPELQARPHGKLHDQISSAQHPFPKMTAAEDAGSADQCEVTSSTWTDDIPERGVDGTTGSHQFRPTPQPLLADVREMTKMQDQSNPLFNTTQTYGAQRSSAARPGKQSDVRGGKSTTMSQDTKKSHLASLCSEEIKLETTKLAHGLASSSENDFSEVSKNSAEKHSEQCFQTAAEHCVPDLVQSTLVQDERGNARKPRRQKRSIPCRYSTAVREEELSELSELSERENDISDDEWKPDINSSSELETDVDFSWDCDHKGTKASRKTHKKILGGRQRSRKSGSLEEQKSRLVQILQDSDNESGCRPLMQVTSVSEPHGSVTSATSSFSMSRNETSTSNTAGHTDRAEGSGDIGLEGQMPLVSAETARSGANAGVAQVRYSRSSRRRRRVPYTKEELTCRECNKVFVNIYRLRRHEGSHREDRPHVCDICGKGFKQSGHRNEHRVTHDTVGRRSFLCNHCGVIISSRSSFRYHMMSHDQLLNAASASNSVSIASSTRSVSGCSSRASPQTLSSDKAKVSPEQARQPEATEATESNGSSSMYTAYDCPHCSDRFATAQSLNSHLESHPEVALRCHVQPFTCEKCGRSFTYRHNLEKHQLLHLKPVKYADLYRRKVQEHIASGKPHFTCDTCGKVYLRKETLAKHCKTHLGIKPFQCHVCCKRFTQKIHLTVHSRLHTGIRPFQCRTCRCCFLDSTALARHVERDLCRQEGFTFNIGKRGRRPFPLILEADRNQDERKKAVSTSVLNCSLCKWRGKRQGNLANHMRRVHSSSLTSPVVSTSPVVTTSPVVRDPPGSTLKITESDPSSAALREMRLLDLSTADVSQEAGETDGSSSQPAHDVVKPENDDMSSLSGMPVIKLNTPSAPAGTTVSTSERADESSQGKDPSSAMCMPDEVEASETPANIYKRTPRKRQEAAETRREGEEDILTSTTARTGEDASGEIISPTKAHGSRRHAVKRTASSKSLSDDASLSCSKAKQARPCEEAADQLLTKTTSREGLSDSTTNTSPKAKRRLIQAANKAAESSSKQISSPRQGVKREALSSEGNLKPETTTRPRTKNALIQTCKINTSSRTETPLSPMIGKADDNKTLGTAALSTDAEGRVDSTAICPASRETDDKTKAGEPKTPRSSRRSAGKKGLSLPSLPASEPTRELRRFGPAKLRPPHSGEIRCNDCGIKFRQISHLNRHLRQHQTPRPLARVLRNSPVAKAGDGSEPTPVRGERSFRCEICGKAFYVRSQLTRHVKLSCSLPSDKIRHKCA